MRKRRGRFLFVGTVLAGLAACGGGSNGTATANDKAEIAALLVRHYKMPSCDDLTAAGRTAFGHPVDDDECAADIATQKSKVVKVTDVAVDGDDATAVADNYRFKLVRRDGVWLIDGGAH